MTENRPGLDEVAYRSGTHGDFLARMLAALSSTKHPALAALRTREPDDPTIALLDAWAVSCDVLTFYTERLANESYLRTSTERTSLQELGKLVAYRLSPGVAAETWLAFALERPPSVASVGTPDPGQVPPAVPAAVMLPAGLRVQSVPGPGELPQTFETVEAIEARPEWNALPVVRTKPHLPVRNRVDAWLAGVGLNLAKGDAILFAGRDLVNDHWDVRLLTDVDVDVAQQRTHVRWEFGLGSYHPYNDPAEAPEPFVLRKRLSVFGHNAPVWSAMNAEFRKGYLKVHPAGAGSANEWPGFVAVTTSGGFTSVDLDGAHPDVVRGSWVVVSQDSAAADGSAFYRELYEVVERSELSRAEFGLSGKVTRLKLHGEAHAFGTPRDVTVMAVPDPLTVVEAPDGTAVAGATVAVEGDATAMVKGRALVVGDADRAEVVTLESAEALGNGRTSLHLLEAPVGTYDRSTALVHGNVTHATHGESVSQILGSGDARRGFQVFPLQQSPLTFVPADNARGSSSTLEVEVDGVRWAERPTTYGAAAGDRFFVTRESADGTVDVVLGDGRLGARPSTGSNNVRATYRKGIGLGGNLATGQLSQALDRPLGLKGVTNPVPAAGAADPEAAEEARDSIPVTVRTLGRAVSLRDFADFALAFTGIGKADAAVLTLRQGRTVVVTVADRTGAPPAPTTVERLAAAIAKQADPNVHVVVLPCRSARLGLSLKVKVDPARDSERVRRAVQDALRARYEPGARAIGEPVHRSAVVAVAASVPGVVAVDLDLLHRLDRRASLQEHLVADPARAVRGGPLAAELLALPHDATGLDLPTEMP